MAMVAKIGSIISFTLAALLLLNNSSQEVGANATGFLIRIGGFAVLGTVLGILGSAWGSQED